MSNSPDFITLAVRFVFGMFVDVVGQHLLVPLRRSCFCFKHIQKWLEVQFASDKSEKK